MLDFTVPAPDSALQNTVETRPKAVAAWLDRLPFASPADMGQQLVTALYALNRHPLGADERNILLALYRPVLERAATSLEALLVETGVPPSAQQRKIGALLRELRIEHSIGYMQILRALNDLRFGRANPKRMAEFTAQLLAALRDIQAACYLTYTAPPAGLWKKLHQLYVVAQASGLADHATETAPSASLAYRQALLLALADPPHMNHSELILTRRYLDHFAELAMLTLAPVEGHRGFAIQSAGDTPPSHLAAAQGSRLWLDTDGVCRHLHETATRLRSGVAPGRNILPHGLEGAFSPRLCKRLLKQWAPGIQRTFRRFATPGSTVQMVAGISAIHRMLESVSQAGRPEVEDTDSVSIGDVAPVFAAAPVAVSVTRWLVSNDSASGLALAGIPDAPLNLKVGDPLALRADDAAAWSLGVIRWIRMTDARQIELGVERLSPQIEPAWVRPLRGERKVSPEPGLFVPGLAALQQPDRLLLSRHLYQSGMDAEMWHAQQPCTLSFGRRLEHTPSFDLIEFTLFADD
jgi:hypothetical protein